MIFLGANGYFIMVIGRTAHADTGRDWRNGLCNQRLNSYQRFPRRKKCHQLTEKSGMAY